MSLLRTESPRAKISKSTERFLSDGVTLEDGEEEYEEESLKAKYEKSLEADRMECEEKLLALRIRKRQQGMRMSQEIPFESEHDLALATEKQYLEPEEHSMEMTFEPRPAIEAYTPGPVPRKSPKTKQYLGSKFQTHHQDSFGTAEPQHKWEIPRRHDTPVIHPPYSGSDGHSCLHVFRLVYVFSR